MIRFLAFALIDDLLLSSSMSTMHLSIEYFSDPQSAELEACQPDMGVRHARCSSVAATMAM